jgi:hypothetical protein
MKRRTKIAIGAILAAMFLFQVGLTAVAVLGYQDFQIISAPGNPASGYLRLSAQTGTLACLTSTGGNCLNFGSGSVTSIATSGPITGGTITSAGTIACATCTVTIASGTSALGTMAISSGACASTVTTTATGVATTDDVIADFNASPLSTTGYEASSSGMLTIIKWPTSGNVNFAVCNNTGSSITPGAVTLNWRVVR